MFFFFSMDNSQRPIGPYKVHYCETCHRRTMHSLIRHHRHVIVLIPLYFSNQYYAICNRCGHTFSVDKKEAKTIQKVNRQHVYTDNQFRHFITEIKKWIQDYDAVYNGKIDRERLVFVKNEIYNTLSQNYDYPKHVMDDWGDYVAETMVTQNDDSILEDDHDFAQRLRTLKELREQGLITDEEYQTKKKEILDKF